MHNYTVKNNICVFLNGPFSNWYGGFNNQPTGHFNLPVGLFVPYIEKYSTTYRDKFNQIYEPTDILSDKLIGFNCSEQAMMFGKAVICGDFDMADIILNTSHPRDQKKLGRQVKDFNENVWAQVRLHFMVDVLFEKFKQHSSNRKLLTEKHKNHIIAEVNPHDSIWGIGLSESDEDSYDVSKWKGINLLGEALMIVRYKLLYPSLKI